LPSRLYLASAVCQGAVLFLRAPAAPSPQAGTQSGALPGVARFGRPLLLAGILAQFAAIAPGA